MNSEGKIKKFYNFINAVKDETSEESEEETAKKIPEGEKNIS